MKKTKVKKSRQFINRSYNDVRSTIESEGGNSIHKDGATNPAYINVKSSLASQLGEIAANLEKDVANAPQKGEGSLPWLSRMSNKMMKNLEKLSSASLYKSMYKDNFYRWDSPEGFAIIGCTFTADFGVCSTDYSEALVSAAGNVMDYPYDYSLVMQKPNETSWNPFANLKQGLDDALNGKLTNVTNAVYKGHYGFYNNTPLVTADMAEFHDLMMKRSGMLEGKQFEYKDELAKFQEQTTVELFTEMVSSITRLMQSHPAPYRPFLESAPLVNGNYEKEPTLTQQYLKSALSEYPDLLNLETQSRKIGPRMAGTQTEFWQQVVDSYDVPSLTERAKKDLNEATDECIKIWLDTVGKVETIPYVAGIRNAAQIKSIYTAIHWGDKEQADEAFEIWKNILKVSLSSECVYAYIKKNTNKGAPYYTSKITDIEWLNLIFMFYERSEDPLATLNTFPFMPGQRLQNSTPSQTSDEIKTRDRIIMGMSAVYMAHQAYNNPLLRAMKQMKEFVSYKSHEDVGTLMQKSLEDLDPEMDTYFLSQDYSGYDKCMGGELMESAIWRFFESIFVNPTNDPQYLKNLFHGEWKHFYSKAPLLVPGGVKTGPHGLFSGAPGTTIIGSIMNWIRTKAMEKHFNIKFKFSYFQGDDTALCYQSKVKIHLDDISNYLAEFGHVVQADEVKQAYMKLEEGKPAWSMFVGKYFFIRSTSGLKLFKPIYSVTDMVARFVFPERAKMSVEENTIRDWSKYDYNDYYFDYRDKSKIDKQTLAPVVAPSISMAVRVTQSLMNIVNHPLFEEIVIQTVTSAPGLFKGLAGYANVKDYYTFEDDGTLIGKSVDDLRVGFLESETANLVMETLTKVRHEYIETIYMEDLEEAIKRYRLTEKRIKSSDIKTQGHNALRSLTEGLKSAFGSNILSDKAVSDLRKIADSLPIELDLGDLA